MDLEKITRQVCDVSREAGAFIKSQSAHITTSDIREKGMHNFVTFVDQQAEQLILHHLSRIIPGSGFIAEESPDLKSRELTWIVDPLDGTTNFIHGLPIHSVSIALARGDSLLSGVIYEVGQDECFYTWKEAPAFLNGKEIRVSSTSKIFDSLFATGFP
jgi:myo-inositol-1(or 4)-monophosphatase